MQLCMTFVRFSIFILTAVCGVCTYGAVNNAPYDVTVGNFYTNPLGLDLQPISFSWKLPQIRDGIEQTAYQIVVYDVTRSSSSRKKQGEHWDSGKVQSSQSVKVPYGGRMLSSRAKCQFKVRYWDEFGKVSDWSEMGTFELGLLKIQIGRLIGLVRMNPYNVVRKSEI